MKGKTHLLLGLVFGLIAVKLFPGLASSFFSKLAFSAFLLVGSLAPDIDIKIKLFRHRGIFHAWYIPALLFIASVFFPAISPAIIAFALGYLSHLLGDMVTLEGIPLLYPLKPRVSGFIRTEGFLELILICALAFLIIFIF